MLEQFMEDCLLWEGPDAGAGEQCEEESQNHRMLGFGRDLCGSSSPTPLPKQGHLEQAAQKFSLMFTWNFLCFSLCPLPLVLSLGTTEKSLVLSS